MMTSWQRTLYNVVLHLLSQNQQSVLRRVVCNTTLCLDLGTTARASLQLIRFLKSTFPKATDVPPISRRISKYITATQAYNTLLLRLEVACKACHRISNTFCFSSTCKLAGEEEFLSYTMWKSPWKNIDPVTRSVAAALLCNLLTQHLSRRQSELCSETLSWILLPIIFEVVKLITNDFGRTTSRSFPRSLETRRVSSTSLWTVALGIATACFFKSEKGMIPYFVSSSNRWPTVLLELTVSGSQL